MAGLGGRMNPVRTCVGCRQRSNRSEMLRVVLHEQVLVPDPRGALTGRGAWLHPNQNCLDSAVTRGAFARAFRSKIHSASQLLQFIEQAENMLASNE